MEANEDNGREDDEESEEVHDAEMEVTRDAIELPKEGIVVPGNNGSSNQKPSSRKSLYRKCIEGMATLLSHSAR